MTDWVTAYRIVRRNGRAVLVYRHQLHEGLAFAGVSWLSWSAVPSC